MTVSEAAVALGVGRDTVLRRIKSGELPFEKLGARLLVIPRDAVEQAQTGRRKTGPKGKSI